jgi:hypothetical protein
MLPSLGGALAGLTLMLPLMLPWFGGALEGLMEVSIRRCASAEGTGAWLFGLMHPS